MYDIIIIGGGPAGLTAAVYGLRNGKSVNVIEKGTFGGQIVNSPKVENIPGFDSISGEEFGDRLLEQAMGQGADVTFGEVNEVIKKDVNGTVSFVVKTAEGETVEGLSIIIATGTTHRVLGLEGEEDLIGSGISFCAVCDGDFYRGRTVVVIGGGNSAFVEANLLADIVDKLIMLQDMPFFTADKKSQEQLFAHDNIETHLETKILGYETDNGTLKGVRYEEDGVEKIAECDGVFLAIGLVPENGIFAHLAKTDGAGYIDAQENCITDTPDVFVAGDCRAKKLRQVATACSDGAIAAVAACEYLKSLA